MNVLEIKSELLKRTKYRLIMFTCLRVIKFKLNSFTISEPELDQDLSSLRHFVLSWYITFGSENTKKTQGKADKCGSVTQKVSKVVL